MPKHGKETPDAGATKISGTVTGMQTSNGNVVIQVLLNDKKTTARLDLFTDQKPDFGKGKSIDIHTDGAGKLRSVQVDGGTFFTNPKNASASGWFDIEEPLEPFKRLNLDNHEEIRKKVGNLLNKTGDVLDAKGGAAVTADAVGSSVKAAKAVGVVAKMTRVLPAVGAVAAGVEGLLLSGNAHAAVESGTLPKEALSKYNEILFQHAVQGGFDPTVVGGEVLVQKQYEDFAKKYGLSKEQTEQLRPSSLLMAGVSNEAIKDKVFENLPKHASPNMPPEIQMLMEPKEMILYTKQQIESQQKSGKDTQNLEGKLAQQKDLFDRNYKELAESGGLKEVMGYIKEHPQNAAPAQVAALLPQAAPMEDRQLVKPITPNAF